MQERIYLGNGWYIERTGTLTFSLPKPTNTPYDCCRLSGTLDFWDNPGEDIYTFEDGELC